MTVIQNGVESKAGMADQSHPVSDHLDVSSFLGTVIRDEVKEVVDHAVTVPRWLEEFFGSFTDLDDEALSTSRYEYLMPQYRQIADVESIGTMVLRLGRHLRTYADLHWFSSASLASDASSAEDTLDTSRPDTDGTDGTDGDSSTAARRGQSGLAQGASE